MKNLVIAGIVVGVLSAIVGAILVLTGGILAGSAQSWARASNLAFLFSIAISLIPKE